MLVKTLLILFTITNLLFVWTCHKDPGYIQKPKNVSFEKLVNKLDPNSLCPTCEVMCTLESRHCFICNRCVEGFDHHCQWVNNCIGEK